MLMMKNGFLAESANINDLVRPRVDPNPSPVIDPSPVPNPSLVPNRNPNPHPNPHPHPHQVDEAEGMNILTKRHEGEVNRVMSNSFGFGGTNACLVFDKYTE